MKLEIFVSRLSLGAQGDDVARVHQALQALGRSVPPAEVRNRVLGPGTQAVVEALQAELDVTATGVVDEATVRAINVRLDHLDTDQRVVRGQVYDANGDAFTSGFVQLFSPGANGEQVVGKSPIDPADGTYRISYQPPQGSNGHVHLRVAVLDGSGALLETIPSGASVLTNAGPLEVVDFVVGGEAHAPRSEFEEILEDLKPLLGDRPLTDLTEDDGRHEISLLALRSGYPSERVAALVRAHRLEQEAALPAPVFYGFLRRGLPASLAALHGTDPGARLSALQAAVERGIVPEAVDGRKLEDVLRDFSPAPAVVRDVQGLLGRVLDPDELHLFVDEYLKDSQHPEAFWSRIEADPAWAERADTLKLTVQVAGLLNNHTPLVADVLEMPDVNEAPDLARLTEEDWKTHIRTEGLGVPEETPGADAEEKIANYARQIVRQVEAAFPTRFLAERLEASSPIATFLKSQPTYDLKTTYPEQFFKAHPDAAQALSAQDRDQLRKLQRVYHLTDSAEEALALVEQKGVGSARQIAGMDRDVFVREHQDIFSEERARAVHAQAQRTGAVALALLGEHAAGMHRTEMHALPKLDGQKQKEAAESADTEEAGIPDWEALFGGFDGCACQECSAAHGPAAYFVDMLRFLGERKADEGSDRSVRDVLFDRRPDLGDLELSCENTNTVLPYIDLVNEILEYAVSPPSPFVPHTLAASLEDDLGEATASAALAAAFDPPLRPGARIEVLEDGRRWRVWDELFAYSITKENGTLEVVARSRQTSGSTEERRATPQYRNGMAYDVLRETVYPFELPFDLPAEEAKVFLAHLGVARHELIEALRLGPGAFEPDAPVVVQLAAERLGLTDTERKIIVGEALDPARQPKDYWGGAQVAALKSVREMLDRAGLSYAELEMLLATWFVNPEQTVTISARPGASVATCDTNELQIDNLTAGALDRLHRFVRLWRKLGWTVLEVDRALRAFAPDVDAPSLTDEVLVRLSHLTALRSQLKISVSEALALWGAADPEEPQDETMRHAAMVKHLRLPDRDLSIALALTGLQPFEAIQSQDAPRFVEVVKAVRNSGFTFAKLDYLIRHQVNPAASFVPTESSLAQALSDVRAGLLDVDAESDVEKKKLQESLVIDRVAALALPADVTASLLRRVSHSGETALQRFLELRAVEEGQPPSRANAAPAFETLEKLLKIADILQALRLPAGLLDWLLREHPWLATAHDQAATPVDFADWFSLVQLPQLRRELALEDAALDAVLSAVNEVVVAADRPSRLVAKKSFVDALEQWLGWAREDVEALVGASDDLDDAGLLSAQVPDAYKGLDLLIRLQRVMGLLKRLGVVPTEADAWCEASVTDEDAKAIRRAASARHSDDAWLKVAIPLQDSLRDRQREALISYLVAPPATWGASGEETEEPEIEKADANDLYAHFLIDVEMSSCQLTSRIKQAIGSVQLFAQRCLMGLEDDVQASEDKWLQWEWMKNFRVWEANRKIWLYPENWIEPELRDDKTPFFKELENELLQTDLDDAAAEQALLRYLEKLDEVARLEIVGVYEDDEDQALHVFGRTFNVPHVYYYRRREGTTRSWTPWEKLELDIEGDHLIPVVWNRRLMLIWPTFTEKAVEKEVEMPEPGGKLKSADRYWEIQLAWSEYQHGRWSGKNLSEAVTFAAYQGEDNVLFGEGVPAPTKTSAIAFKPVGNGSLPPDDDGGNGGGSGGTTPVPPRGDTSTAPRRLVSRELFSFKAFASDETLTVRGYLRRDYRAAPVVGDSQIACVFGEFRFFGCRKIITTAHRKQIARQNFALAPTGAKLDRMWFTQTGSGLTLFDGQFPVYQRLVRHEAVLGTINEPASIAGDPSDTLENKLNIPVLAQTPSAFRLLAPHQDLQFVGDRPFFFMDGRRAFMVTSTGSSTKRPDLTGWVDANLATAWRADYFPKAPPTLPGGNGGGAGAESVAASLVVLAPGPGGRRVMREMAPVNTQPEFRPRTLIPTFQTTRAYRFVNFHHPYLCAFEKTLNRRGIAALFSLDTQSTRDAQSFDAYAPEARVLKEYPADEVEFQSAGAYEVYNWELFFHIPLLIATRLKANQRFREARRWFHFIFDPTGASGGAIPQRYWRTKPFHDRLKETYEAESVRAIEEMIANGISEELKVAVEVWRTNPFSPHAVARLRTTAYQKTVVMKYIDNLIAWGDQLFRRETLESINEATQLYVLAAEILGRRPEVIERNPTPAVRTFNTLDLRPGGLSNALEQLELLVPDAGSPGANGDASQAPDPPSDTVLYFCTPENDRLLGYWNAVADRLFKIRHCMNIEGQVRQLPLFEPPLDPALLVRAQAAGLSIGEVLSDIDVSLPNYRFSVMLQKANELAAEVRSLGAGLLSALEKRDAEALSTLRSSQELRLLQAIRGVRIKQVDEAKATLAALEKSREMAQARKEYYESREFKNLQEATSIALSSGSIGLIEQSRALRYLAGKLASIGALKLGSPTTAGVEIGPDYAARSLEADAGALDAASNLRSVRSQLAGRAGEFTRRKDEWDHQANLATVELKQIEQQLIAAQIRLAAAEQELRNHDRQIDNADEVDQFLRSKFTSQDLYQWMIGQTSGLYFQSYQLAYDMAKRAERCFRFELGLQDSSYIQFGYWDSLKKGLLAGERLQHDLRRLESAYMDQNDREYELTKHVSLLQVDPLALIQLRATGRCTVRLPEALFDTDGPGHYFRRIKTVAVSIPCVTGPYASVNCTLTLLKSSIRTTQVLREGIFYAREGAEHDRFSDNFGSLQSVVTSSAQNDSGLFETNLRDERYLPFENSGVISEWQLQLPADPSQSDPAQFDYDTISDVILHLRYTAREGGGLLRRGATAHVKELISEAQAVGSVRLFSARHEFPTEWANFQSQSPAPNQRFELALNLRPEHYPFWSRGRLNSVTRVDVIAKSTEDPVPGSIGVADKADTSDATAKQDTLGKDSSLGDLLVGKLTNMDLPARPDGELKLFFDTNEMSDVWIAATWK